MVEHSQTVVSGLLRRMANGDMRAADELFPIIYNDLRERAAHLLKNRRASHTLQPTALVNEAYIRLIGNQDLNAESRTHFLALAARVMRQILVEHARAKNAKKRGGDRKKLPLDDVLVAVEDSCIDLIDLDSKLQELALRSENQARVVELRFFGGLTWKEIAALLGVQTREVSNDWRLARAWLYRELGGLSEAKDHA